MRVECSPPGMAVSYRNMSGAVDTLHTQPFYGPRGFCPGLPGCAGTRKVKPIWNKR